MRPRITLRCSPIHRYFWNVTYDIGHDQMEQILVCCDCYESCPCFRLYEVKKESMKFDTNFSLLARGIKKEEC